MQEAFGQNAPILISYVLAAACYNDVRAVARFFPLLTFTGTRGSGKTAAARATQRPLGGAWLNIEALPLQDLNRIIKDSRSHLHVLDEFDGSRPSITHRIKGIYEGAPCGSAGAILCTQHPASNQALLHRSLVVHFDGATHTAGSYLAAQELVDPYAPGFLRPFIPDVMYRETFYRLFEENKKAVQMHYSHVYKAEAEGRLIDNAAVLFTAAEFTTRICHVELPFTLATLMNSLAESIHRSK
jgi:hypothetical protein